MKRPWQIWLMFCGSLAVAVLGMTWLTVHTLALDRAEAVARRQAELEERVSVALWRMDSMLTPLIGQEAARPYTVYQPFMLPPTKGKGQPLPTPASASPLLNQPSEYVLLHFELGADNALISPQCPAPQHQELALTCGATPDNLKRSRNRLDELTTTVSRQQLLEMLPDQRVPGPEALAQNNAQAIDAQAQQEADYNLFVSNAQAPQMAQPQSREQPATAPNPQSSLPGRDYWQRGARYQTYAQQEKIKQQLNRAEVPQTVMVSEGVSRPLWIDDRLLLARKVDLAGQDVVQGCWLNWDRIKAALLAEIADLNLRAELVPRAAEASIVPSRMLAGLPIELRVPRAVAVPESFSPTQLSLLFAWSGLALAAVSVAVLLTAVVALSERRAAFVSAVTHELRTPLTTFRMYSEMLSSGMIDDEQRRRSYLQTLRTEADRLTQLVANVLSYARLERTGKTGSLRAVPLGDLIERIDQRLTERASDAGMALEIELDAAARQCRVQTDASVVEQILFNLVDNACKYGNSGDQKQIRLGATVERRYAVLRISDDGPGISPAGVRRLFRPFSKTVEEAAETAPGIGLGLALCQRLARQLGGRLEYDAQAAAGACFVLKLPRA